MKPTLAAAQLRGSLTQYLTTTHALTEKDTRGALERFPGHPETGIFRGPYLRIRTPFHLADDGWRRHPEWSAGFPGFTPWRHQARAWERLSTLRGPARPWSSTTALTGKVRRNGGGLPQAVSPEWIKPAGHARRSAFTMICSLVVPSGSTSPGSPVAVNPLRR